MKLLFRLSICGYTAGLFVKALSMLTLTESERATLSTNSEAFSITTDYGVWSTLSVSAADQGPHFHSHNCLEICKSASEVSNLVAESAHSPKSLCVVLHRAQD